MMIHGSVVRPTMFLASLDMKRALDEARPRHVAKNMESHDQHGWLRLFYVKCQDLSDVRMCRELVHFQSMSPPKKSRSSRLWHMIAAELLGCEEGKWEQNNMGLLLNFKGEKAHQTCSFMWDDNFWIMHS